MGTQARHVAIVTSTMAEAIEGIERGEDPLITIASRLGEAVRADAVCYGRMDVRSGDGMLRTWPDAAVAVPMAQAARTIPRSHPVLDYWLSGRTEPAAVSSVVTDQRAWRNSEAYAVLEDGLGCTETGGIRLDDGPHTLHMLGVARHVDFTAEEVALLTLMRAPTIAVARHVEWLRTWSRSPGVASPDGPAQRAASVGLTMRELQVLHLLADGLLASTMAARLSISVRTVHRHLAHIYAKLDTHDRLAAVVRAQRLGLLLSSPDAGTDDVPAVGARRR